VSGAGSHGGFCPSRFQEKESASGIPNDMVGSERQDRAIPQRNVSAKQPVNGGLLNTTVKHREIAPKRQVC
jgi:hypothetical protein